MNIHVNRARFFRNSLNIGSAIFLILGASFIIPKIADAALTLNHEVPRYSIHDAMNSLGDNKANSQDSLNEYQPPDFGHPSSAYGSGTR